MNEDLLIQQAGRKDLDAWEKLIHLYKRPIYRFIYRMVHHQADADDLSQLVFLSAFKHIDSFKVGTNFRAWFYQIAKHLCVDFFRRRSKEEKKRIPLIENEAMTPAHSTDSEIGLNDLQKRVAEALETLPESQKIIMTLHLEGLSHQEISRIINRPEATVRWRLFYARKKLKNILSDYLH
ncbi:MAG: RNA polymerase sigma factor [Planctomycetota bacterium]